MAVNLNSSEPNGVDTNNFAKTSSTEGRTSPTGRGRKVKAFSADIHYTADQMDRKVLIATITCVVLGLLFNTYIG